MLRANRTAIIDDLGGELELSHIQLAIIDRYIFLEALLAQLERDIATKPKLASELVGRWIQAVNSLTGLAKTLGITRKRGCQDWADHKPNDGFLNVESAVIAEARK